MFERFTEKGIKVIMLAQEETRRLKHNFVGSEYILLGLIGEGTGIAAKSLKAFNVNLKDARIEVEKLVGRGDGSIAVEIPFTSDGKRQLEYAWDEARGLGHNYVGTEHLLLGLLRLEGGDGLKTLQNLGVDTAKLRDKAIALLGQAAGNKGNKSHAKDLDPIEDEISKALFEAVVSALPRDARPIVLELREIICAKEKAVELGQDDRAESLHSHESKLLTKLWQLTAQSSELGKVMFELREVRWQKEIAIKAQEFEKAASLREKETELSQKLRELEANSDN